MERGFANSGTTIHTNAQCVSNNFDLDHCSVWLPELLASPQFLWRSGGANRRFEFHKSGQLFIRTHNEALTVAAMRVSNEDRSTVGIRR